MNAEEFVKTASQLAENEGFSIMPREGVHWHISKADGKFQIMGFTGLIMSVWADEFKVDLGKVEMYQNGKYIGVFAP